MKTLITATLAFGLMAGASSAATLVNGSFDGPTGSGIVPTGWDIISPSPDTNNQTTSGAGGSYFVAADDSTDGGTWVGFGRNQGTNEILGQTITDFMIGQSYELSWEAANFGIGGFPEFNNPNSILVSLDGAGIGSGAALDVTSSWFDQSLTFTATATTHTLSFGLVNDISSYLQLDGVSLSAVSPVPVPAAGLLLLTALGGVAATRRKKKANA